MCFDRTFILEPKPFALPRKTPIALLLLCTFHLAGFTQNFEISPPPKWVIEVDPNPDSEVSKYDVNGGFYNALIDYQSNFEKEEEFTHQSLNIVTAAGITSASEIYITYDSSFQSLNFHYLHIWRNGKMLDRTADLSFEFLTNEQNLGIGIYTGALTAYEILKDIRRDDVIEYAYTIKGSNPLYEGNNYEFLYLDASNPIDRFHIRIIHADKEKHTIECRNCGDLKLDKDVKDGMRIYSFDESNIEAIDVEESQPSWHIPFRHILSTQAASWTEINDWGLEIFKVDGAQEELDNVFEEVLTGSETEVEKISALLDFTQNDIRYMGVETGMGSIRPFMPNQVIKQRFGDCKDKTLLFVELMHKMGVKTVYPALVNTAMTHSLINMLPGRQIFDHVVVCMDYKGKRYWIDPTISQQGGDFMHRSMVDYGYALIVKEGNNRLAKMSIEDDYSRMEITEEYVISNFEDPAELTVTSKLHGLNADQFRMIIEYYSVKEASDELRMIYANLYPNILERAKLKVKDDMVENVITLTESYTIPDHWREEEGYLMKLQYFQYEPIALYEYVSPIACEIKKQPVEVPYPSYFKQHTILHLPEEIGINVQDQHVDNVAFKYDKTAVSESPKHIELNYFYQTKTREIEAEAFIQVCKDMNTMTQDLPIKISYPLK